MNLILCWYLTHRHTGVCFSELSQSANSNNIFSSENSILSDAVCHEIDRVTGTAGPTYVVLYKNSLLTSDFGTGKSTDSTDCSVGEDRAFSGVFRI